MTEARFSLAMVSAGGSRPFAAMVVEDFVIALTAFADVPEAALPTGAQTSVRAVLEVWDEAFPRLQHARAALDTEEALRDRMIQSQSVRFHPPVDGVRQVFCIGANYRQHVIGLMLGDPDMKGVGREGVTDPAELRRLAEETMDERAAGGLPYAFLRLPDTLSDPSGDVFLPRHILKPDWELELAVVIGRTAHKITAERAMQHVAGYAIINDMTARDLVFRKDMPAMGSDWLVGKNWPRFAPFGPYLVPSAFVADPYDLYIHLTVNGRVMQDETTADMVIRIDRQIAYLSSIVTLHPGDVIATGSPAGNGAHHGVFLMPGDRIEGQISGLGGQAIICT